MNTEQAIEGIEREIQRMELNQRFWGEMINYHKAALSALRAKQNREAGCKFCANNFYSRSLYKFCPYCGHELDHEPKEARG